MYNDNFEKWQDQWEKAMNDGVFDKEETEHKKEFNLRDVDSEYWDKMAFINTSKKGYVDPLSVINEKNDVLVPTEKPDGKSNSKITDELGPTPNPTNTTNREVDNRRHVTPNWAGGAKIIELHDMRIALQRLEDKLAVDPMLEDKKSKSVMDQIEAIWKRLNTLSDSLAPNYTTEYQD